MKKTLREQVLKNEYFYPKMFHKFKIMGHSSMTDVTVFSISLVKSTMHYLSIK